MCAPLFDHRQNVRKTVEWVVGNALLFTITEQRLLGEDNIGSVCKAGIRFSIANQHDRPTQRERQISRYGTLADTVTCGAKGVQMRE